MTVFVPESPRYLYGINKLDECKKVFNTVAKWNKIENYKTPEFEVDTLIIVGDVDEFEGDEPGFETRDTGGFGGLGRISNANEEQPKEGKSFDNKESEGENLLTVRNTQ